MSSPSEIWRTFIAIPLPSDWQCALSAVMGQLASSTPPDAVRWSEPSNIHLTLRFLGNTDPAAVPDIIALLQQSIPGMTAPALSLSGLGTFPARRQPRVVWAGLAGDLEPLAQLQYAAASAAVALGWPAETRPFQPHLTLGRVRDRADANQRQSLLRAIAATTIPPASIWHPHAVRLYRSILTPHGPVYTNLGEAKISEVTI